MTRHVAPDADPITRCGSCGYARNPYRHAHCPICYVDGGEGYWLGCDQCGWDWLTPEPPIGAKCPHCEAGAAAIAEVR